MQARAGEFLFAGGEEGSCVDAVREEDVGENADCEGLSWYFR